MENPQIPQIAVLPRLRNTVLLQGRPWKDYSASIVVWVFFAVMIVATVVKHIIDSNNDEIPESEKPKIGKLLWTLLGLVLAMIFNVYVMDCLVHGGCIWYAGLIALLIAIATVALVFGLVL